MKKIVIFVATHKPYWMPKEDCYVPLHLGSKGKDSIGFLRDDEGDNISEKNTSFCELTGLYWAWKNVKADYVGLVHYRRYFSKSGKLGKNKKNVILSKNDIEELLKKDDVILPCRRKYYIETNRSQYEHAHNPKDLQITKEILKEFYSDYIPYFEMVMKRTWGHRFNMFIMNSQLFNRYCEWLFDILFKLEKRVDISLYNSYNVRIFGFISERLLDVWIERNKIKYVESPVVFMEKQNWIFKIWRFVYRKIRGGVNYEK